MTGKETGGKTETRRLDIADWESRFWAWLIDVLLVGAAANALWSAIGVFALTAVDPFELVEVGWFGGLNGVGLWLYWTLLEGYRGQSLGKLVMDLRVTDRRGDPIEYGPAAIESFGKAFLLPLDFLIGVFAYEGRKLRLFNRLSETIVIETEGDGLEEPDGVEYVMPEDR